LAGKNFTLQRRFLQSFLWKFPFCFNFLNEYLKVLNHLPAQGCLKAIKSIIVLNKNR
jgi:hypothetical protein